MIRHKQFDKLDPGFVQKKLNEFFKEDNTNQDITTETTQNNKKTQAFFIAKEDLVFAGKEIIIQGFNECSIDQIQNDGTTIKAKEPIATLSGPIDMILKKERVVLNLLQRLSGIATKTNKILRE